MIKLVGQESQAPCPCCLSEISSALSGKQRWRTDHFTLYCLHHKAGQKSVTHKKCYFYIKRQDPPQYSHDSRIEKRAQIHIVYTSNNAD